ncbi:laminin subunit alpha [Lycorma delicatula]|uniref:laminin subunit alpha n=1 Tax=Lycorma delicatula TaxID=130591 RepID=UPI003F514E66
MGEGVRSLRARLLWITIVLYYLPAFIGAEVLTPPYFNLALGRRIEATATCGEGTTAPELYCKLVGFAEQGTVLIQGLVCDNCDPASEDRKHPPEFAVDGAATWWQSPPLSRGMKYNEVNLTIDLGQEFHVAYVLIKMANSPRPGVWALERSADNGKTYQPWQYFADTRADCEQFFGPNITHTINSDDAVICETQYSKIVPLEGGEIAISLLHNRPSANDFFNSSVLQEWTRATNVRLRLLRTKTLLGHLMSVARQDPTVTRRYFYSIQDISIGGRCRCNGHADTCDITDPDDQYKLICRCQHNTCGHNCEYCCPGFEQKAWSQSKYKKPFVCEPCNCFKHSEQCIYNSTIDELHLSLDIHGKYEGGGVCQNCRDNTEGINCDKCKSGFYRPYNVPLDQTDVCKPCNCNQFFATGNCAEGSGQCECKPEFNPPLCDSCSFGHYGYPECRPCDCHINGTEGDHCEATDGKCPCKPNYSGKFCDQCAEGFYNFPECIPCECNPLGSDTEICDVVTGQCQCLSNFGGRKCDQCGDRYYDFPQCHYCSCDIKGTEPTVCDKTTGQCLCNQGYGGVRCDQCTPGYFHYPDCQPCNCSEDGSSSSVCDVTGKCPCLSNFGGRTCEQCNPGFYKYPECLACNCDSHGSIGVSCDNEGKCQCAPNFAGIHCEQCRADLYNFPICEECNCNPAGVLATFAGCGSLPLGELCQCKPRVQGRVCDQCRPLYWNLQPNNVDGCEDCDCYSPGVMGEIKDCDGKAGQCLCKSSVTSRRCDVCADGYYNLNETNLFGCTACGCNIGGSLNDVCDKNTGQCECQPRISGRTCNEPLKTHYFPTLHQYLYEAEDGTTRAQNPVRYGFNERDFPGYSWKGYAHMSPLQDEIVKDIYVNKPSLYRLVLRYVNPNNVSVIGKITITPENPADAEQNFQVLFKPTRQPAFVTVSGPTGGIPSPIVMDPGLWTVSIKNEKRLSLDYFVLLPAAFYEASVLLNHVASSCTVGSKTLCRQYQYPSLNNYDTVRGEGAFIERDDSNQPFYETYTDPEQLKERRIPLITSNQPVINFDLTVTHPGPHVLAVNYVTTEESIPRKSMLDINVQTNSYQESGKVIIYPCRYTTVCRQIVVDNSGKVAVFNFDQNYVRLLLKGEDYPNIAIDSIVAIPYDKWSTDYIRPKPSCVQEDGKCVDLDFVTPPESKRIEFESGNDAQVAKDLPSNIYDNTTKLIYLDHKDSMVDVSGKVPQSGQYVFVVHYYQPDHPDFDMDVIVQNGQFYEANLPVPHCPSNVGCRSVVKQSNGNNRFQLTENFVLTVKEPNHKSAWLDYLLAVPAEEFTDSVTLELPLDETGLFITKCGSNHFYQNTSVTGFCRDAIFLLTTAYNNGALPCDCDYRGSLSFDCNKFGGQCPCKPNVIGRRCEICKTGYYGYPDCHPCKCPSEALCETSTGACFCPRNVTGDLCDHCEDYTFNYDPIFGCEPCSCNPHGVENGNLQCNLFSGTCDCKPNIVGRTCDHCESGHWSFPNCRPCDCDLRGTEYDICDQNTAECFCKSNVYGQACDLCKEGTFNIQEKNPEGCTKCFCFGKSTRCSSSTLYRSQMTGMDNWSLAVINVTKVVSVEPVHVNIEKVDDGIGADLTDDGLVGDKVTYFVAPGRYLQNKLTSYGGILNYSIFYTTGLFGNAIRGPDVIFYGAGIYLLHYSLEQPAANLAFTGNVEIYESSFILPTGLPASREQLMQVLEDLRGIYIKATYWQQSVTTRLSRVSMDIASSIYTLNADIALAVEQCQCPPNYEGLSCEHCADGYYRAQTGPFGGFCVPCQCNGHSTTCDKVTGVCIDCKNNTTGEHCEFCNTGYHGNATLGTPYDCLICACPLPLTSNNFATSCEVSDDGERISCNCNEGYYGARCEVCSNGYYGRPSVAGEYCRPCECSGNINPEDDGACDSVTGKCIRCLNNTAGDSCQYCAPDYFGDAVSLKDCQSCVCDKCGAKDCDHRTGICNCHPHVVGEKCDRCDDQHYGFSTCQGCKPCDCQLASESLQCDDTSGQCRCKPGVTGRNCDRCAPGFWNYSESGCITCGCNTEYSVGVGCNPVNGQCECLPGVIGEKCDHCPHRWVLIPDSGCFDCDVCTHSLLDTTDALQLELEPVTNEFQSVAVSYFTTQRLVYINDTVNQLSPNVSLMFTSQVDLSPIQTLIESLAQDSRTINRKAEYTVKSAEKSKEDIKENEAKDVKALVLSAEQQSHKTVDEVAQLAYNLENAAGPRIDEALKEASSILSNITNQNSSVVSLAEETDSSIKKSEDLLGDTKVFVAPVQNITSALNAIRSRIQQLDNRLKDLRSHADSAQQKAIEAGALNVKNRQANVNSRISAINTLADESQKTAEDANNKKAAALSDYKDAKNGYDRLNFERARLNTAKKTIEDIISSNTNALPSVQEEVRKAEDYAHQLDYQAKSLDNLLSSIKNSSESAVEAANAYKNIADAINEALQAASDAGKSGSDAINISEGLGGRTSDTSNKSGKLNQDAQQSLQTVQRDLEPHLKKAEDDVHLVESLNKEASDADDKINRELEQLESRNVSESSQEAGVKAQDLTEEANQISNIQNILDTIPEQRQNSEQLYKNSAAAHNAVTHANNQLDEVQTVLPNIVSLKDTLEDRINNLNRLSNSIQESLKTLKERVTMARDLAKRINIGTTFYRNSTLELKNPDNLAQQGLNSVASIYFLTDKPNGLVFYIGNEIGTHRRMRRTNTDDFMALEIENGFPTVTIDLGSGPTKIINDKFVADDQWYQAIIERVGKTVKFIIREDVGTKHESKIKDNIVEDILPGRSVLLNLDKDYSKIFVGGYPGTFEIQPQVKYTSFEGRMEELVIGDERVSLWNFVDASNIVQGSKERDRLVSPAETSVRMSGDGYITLDKQPYQMKPRTDIKFNFKTFAKEGLMFLAFKDNQNFLSIELREGRVLYQYNLGSGILTLSSSKEYNDNEWHSVEAARVNKTGVLKIDGETIEQNTSPGDSLNLEVSDDIYMGGYPRQHDIADVTNADFDGCLDEVQIDGTIVDLNKNKNALDIRPGCPAKFSGLVSFEAGARGYARVQNVMAQDNIIQIILRFKTTAPKGLIAYASNGGSGALLTIEDGILVFNSGGTEVKTSTGTRFDDGQWHVVVATHNPDALMLDIDDYDSFSSEEIPRPIRLLHGNLFFGGVSSNEDAGLAISPQFSGCIGDATLNGAIVNFGNLSEIPSAIVGKCIIDTPKILLRRPPPPPPIIDRGPPPPLIELDETTKPEESQEVIDVNEEVSDYPVDVPPTLPPPAITTLTPSPTPAGECALPLYPASDPDAYSPMSGHRFGTQRHSRFEYNNLLPRFYKNKHEFSVDIKTIATDGLIFYISDARHIDFIALFLKDGNVNYRFNCGSGSATLLSKKVVNDGEWHSITFYRNATEGKLLIDNEVVAEGESQGSTKTINVNNQPLFIGGFVDPFISDDSKTTMKMNLFGLNATFEGCLRNLKKLGLPFGEPDKSVGVIPCSNKVESGVFFSANGGYIKGLNEKFKVGIEIDIKMEIKPRNVSGLLLLIHGKRDYLVLQMIEGVIKFSIDNGKGEISTSYKPSNPNYFCDGQWHTVQAAKTKNVVVLSVDKISTKPGLGKGPQSTDTTTPIFFGGHPNPRKLRGVGTTEQFVGCMSQVVINQKVENIGLYNAVGNVTLSVCPII